MSGQPVLELRGVSKSFPGVAALTDVSIEIRPHEVLGLIGENGAGKSTLLKMLTGLEQPDTGELLVRGERVALRGVTAANAQGIAMVFQEQSLLENMLVGENVLLGTEGPAVRFGVYRWGQIRRRAQHYLDVVGGDLRAGEQTSRLSFAKRQMVEVAKALATGEHGNDQPRHPARRADLRARTRRDPNALPHRARAHRARERRVRVAPARGGARAV